MAEIRSVQAFTDWVNNTPDIPANTRQALLNMTPAMGGFFTPTRFLTTDANNRINFAPLRQWAENSRTNLPPLSSTAINTGTTAYSGPASPGRGGFMDWMKDNMWMLIGVVGGGLVGSMTGLGLIGVVLGALLLGGAAGYMGDQNNNSVVNHNILGNNYAPPGGPQVPGRGIMQHTQPLGAAGVGLEGFGPIAAVRNTGTGSIPIPNAGTDPSRIVPSNQQTHRVTVTHPDGVDITYIGYFHQTPGQAAGTGQFRARGMIASDRGHPERHSDMFVIQDGQINIPATMTTGANPTPGANPTLTVNFRRPESSRAVELVNANVYNQFSPSAIAPHNTLSQAESVAFTPLTGSQTLPARVALNAGTGNVPIADADGNPIASQPPIRVSITQGNRTMNYLGTRDAAGQFHASHLVISTPSGNNGNNAQFSLPAENQGGHVQFPMPTAPTATEVVQQMPSSTTNRLINVTNTRLRALTGAGADPVGAGQTTPQMGREIGGTAFTLDTAQEVNTWVIAPGEDQNRRRIITVPQEDGGRLLILGTLNTGNPPTLLSGAQILRVDRTGVIRHRVNDISNFAASVITITNSDSITQGVNNLLEVPGIRTDLGLPAATGPVSLNTPVEDLQRAMDNGVRGIATGAVALGGNAGIPNLLGNGPRIIS